VAGGGRAGRVGVGLVERGVELGAERGEVVLRSFGLPIAL